jgi:hypothetical protein
MCQRACAAACDKRRGKNKRKQVARRERSRLGLLAGHQLASAGKVQVPRAQAPGEEAEEEKSSGVCVCVCVCVCVYAASWGDEAKKRRQDSPEPRKLIPKP